MATYGYDEYGQSTYGPSAPTGPYPGAQAVLPVVNTNFILPSFTATPQDYTTVYIEWTPMVPAEFVVLQVAQLAGQSSS